MITTLKIHHEYVGQITAAVDTEIYYRCVIIAKLSVSHIWLKKPQNIMDPLLVK